LLKQSISVTCHAIFMYVSIPCASSFSNINPLSYSCMLYTYLWQSLPFWNKTSTPTLL